MAHGEPSDDGWIAKLRRAVEDEPVCVERWIELVEALRRRELAPVLEELGPRVPIEPEPNPEIEELLWPGCGKGEPGEPASPARIRWAQLLKHIWDDDLAGPRPEGPTEGGCPSCGIQMDLISIITLAGVVKKILEAVGLPADSPARAPPSSHHDLAA